MQCCLNKSNEMFSKDKVSQLMGCFPVDFKDVSVPSSTMAKPEETITQSTSTSAGWTNAIIICKANPPPKSAQSQDGAFSYNCALLTDGYLFFNFLDAIKEGMVIVWYASTSISCCTTEQMDSIALGMLRNVFTSYFLCMRCSVQEIVNDLFGTGQ